ncbi:hypothetical protein HPB47_010521, partial [Ixodes persulcatus]
HRGTENDCDGGGNDRSSGSSRGSGSGYNYGVESARDGNRRGFVEDYGSHRGSDELARPADSGYVIRRSFGNRVTAAACQE